MRHFAPLYPLLSNRIWEPYAYNPKKIPQKRFLFVYIKIFHYLCPHNTHPINLCPKFINPYRAFYLAHITF